MKERTKFILEIAVKDFIKRGRPITSEWLYECHDFGIKPAMIRWELSDLSELGFLSQLHPSGGRVPTDKAYRFLVDGLMREDFGAFGVWHGLEEIIDDFLHGERKSFVGEMADYLKTVGIGYEPESDYVYESGLDILLNELEVEKKEELIDVVKELELMDGRLKDFHSKLGNNEPKVFVGGNPLVRNDRLSIVAENFDNGRDIFTLIAVGPKRMDYRKSLRFFRSIENNLRK